MTDKWEFVAPMRSPRSALSVAVLGGKLYALGTELFEIS
jgi:kelch-like protein 19